MSSYNKATITTHKKISRGKEITEQKCTHVYTHIQNR